MRTRKVIEEIASAVTARANCERVNNREWFIKHSARIGQLVTEFMPHGSGFDSGTTFDIDASHEDKLVFGSDFHHMNDAGFYDGWTHHKVTVTPSFNGLNIKIGGRDRNQIKEHIAEEFMYALNAFVRWDLEEEKYRRVNEQSSEPPVITHADQSEPGLHPAQGDSIGQ